MKDKLLLSESASNCRLLYVRLSEAKKWRRLLQLMKTKHAGTSGELLLEIYGLGLGKRTTQSSAVIVIVSQWLSSPRLPHGRECKYVDDSDVYLHLGISPRGSATSETGPAEETASRY